MARIRRKATGSGRDPSRKRSSTSETGVFRSVRDGSEHVFESGHEKRHLIAMDVDPTVLSYEVQPETFDLGGGRSYTPDALVVTEQGSGYREVKPERLLSRDPGLRGRRMDIEAAAADRGAGFSVVTEATYGDPTVAANANLLRHAARWDLPAAREQAMRFMAEHPTGIPLVDLVRRLRMGIVGRFAVLRLVAIGHLSIDMSREIGPETVVALPAARS